MVGNASDAHSVVRLVAGHSSGEPVYENVLTDPVAGRRVRLAHTPSAVLGVAAGDIIEVDTENGTYDLVSRGGNIAVQVYGPPVLAMSIEPKIRKLGGWHDGGVKNLTIFTVPASAGFEELQSILNTLAAADGRIEWYYGNVYADDGITPLGWWDQS